MNDDEQMPSNEQDVEYLIEEVHRVSGISLCVEQS